MYVDPANDAGSAGDNLGVWFLDVRVGLGLDTNCTSWYSYGYNYSPSAPPGQSGNADEVRRTSTSDAYTAWSYTCSPPANQTWTFSVWLKAGTFSGNIVMRMSDGGGSPIVSSTVTPTGTWQRFTLTGTFGSSPAANVGVSLDPAEGGSVGETYLRYGVMLQQGPAATTFQPYATVKAGDMLGMNSELKRIMADATSNDAGDIPVEFQPRARAAWTVGNPVTWSAPTATFRLKTEDVPSTPWEPGMAQGVSLEFVEVV
jgi:hypothetical protein